MTIFMLSSRFKEFQKQHKHLLFPGGRDGSGVGGAGVGKADENQNTTIRIKQCIIS